MQRDVLRVSAPWGGVSCPGGVCVLGGRGEAHVIDARVDDLAIARGRLGAGEQVPLEEERGGRALRESACYREAYCAGAYYL